MSERPPGVKIGDRVQITTIHTGTITEIDDTGFLLEEAHGGCITGHVRGRFSGNEMTWEVLPIPPDEPPIGWWLAANGLIWRHDPDGWRQPKPYGKGEVRAWSYLLTYYFDRWPEAWQLLAPAEYDDQRWRLRHEEL